MTYQNTMNKFLLGILFLPVVALGEQATLTKPVVCDDVKLVIEFVKSQPYYETLYWAGKDENSHYAMLVNEKTKTWTLIQFDEKTACVLGSGENHTKISTTIGS